MDKLFSRCLIVVSILSVLLFFHTARAGNKRFSPNFNPVVPVKYEVQDLSADVFSDNTLLLVSGKIKNTSFRPVQGYVLIRFQDVNNMELGYVETALNQNQPIQHNALGAFEIFVNIKGNSNISNVSVEFVNSGR